MELHYVNFHNADENDFFKKLFYEGQCFHCDYFCINRRDEKNHNFSMHYQLSVRQTIEDKPLKKTFLMKI